MTRIFSRRQRLLGPQDFSRVFNSPDFRASSRHLLVLAATSGADCPRLGLVISRKNVGNAVARNRVKRMCREAFRSRAADFATIDIIVLARSGSGKLDNKALTAMLHTLFDQLSEKHGRPAVASPHVDTSGPRQ